MKPSRADKVEHGGELASREKIDEMLSLRSQVGGVMSACIPTKECKAPALCSWHKMLSGYKDKSKQPLRDLDKMSPAQIDHLIDRAKTYIAKQGARAAEQPDLGAIVVPEATDIRSKLAAATDTDEAFAEAEQRIGALFSVDKITDITDQGDRSTALQLVLAYANGPEAFEKALTQAKEAA